jgi:hypothetical protein
VNTYESHDESSAYELLADQIFSEEDRAKFEWAVGAALTGVTDKILVISGGPSSGKSTMLSIVEEIFSEFTFTSRASVMHDGYTSIKNPGFVFAASAGGKLLPTTDPVILDRLIVAVTTGNRFPIQTYSRLVAQARREHEMIANQCIERYRELGPNYFDNVQENN